MTARRFHTSPTVTPARTGGDDQPRGACYGLAESVAPDPTCFDLLIDLTAGPVFNAARREARALCGVRDDGMFRAPDERCPLAATCLMRDNADEPWARAVMGLAPPKLLNIEPRNRSNASRHHQEQAAARLADLRALTAAGAGLEECCNKLRVNRDALYKWCRANGHLDLWRQIKPPKPAAVTARRDPRRNRVAA